MGMRILAFFLVFSLAGCATCREHKAACVVVSAILAGSIAATIENNRHSQQPSRQTSPPACFGVFGQVLCDVERGR